MNTTLSSTIVPESAPSRAQGIWLVTVQVVGILGTATALLSAGKPEKPVQMLLALLCAAFVALAAVPAWRQSALAGVLGGLTLATACWLGANGHTYEITFANGDVWDIPFAAFGLAGGSFLLALWGVPVMRRGPRPVVGFGGAAVIGALIVSALALLLFLGLNYVPVIAALYPNAVGLSQLLGVVTPVCMYGLALWLGGAGVRPGARVALQPPLLAAAIAVALIFWHVKR